MAEIEELGLEVFVDGWRNFERIMDNLDDSVHDSAIAFEDLSEEVAQSNIVLNAIESTLGDVARDMKRMADMSTVAEEDVEDLGEEVDDTSDKTERFGSVARDAFVVTLGNLAASAIRTTARLISDIGRKVVDFTADSVSMAADFQGSMAGLSIAASSTGMTFDELKDAALAVGGDTRLLGATATGAAESMEGLFKAGLTGAEIFGDLNAFMNEGAELGGALRASFDLAAASELDVEQASDLAAIALASFGSEMETEAQRAEFINTAMNNMVKAADASVAEVGGLAAALRMVGPTAGAAGMPIEDINNALAILSTRGIEGSMAGTSLNRMLLDLGKTTDDAVETMEKLGINVYDVEGNLLPLVDIVGQFEDALGDATDEEKNAALQAIFTAQGQRAINTLLTEGKGGWNDMAKATKDAAGIQEQAAIKSKTLNAKLEAVEGTLETFRIKVGDALLPIVEGLLPAFGEIIAVVGPKLVSFFENTLAPILIKVGEFFSTFIDFILSGADPVSALMGALTEVGLSEFADQLWDAITAVEEFLKPIIKWIDDNIELRDILIGIAIAISTFVIPAIISLMASAAAIIVPILAIIGAVVLLRKAWESDFMGMRTAITNFWENKVKPAFAEVVKWLQTNIPIAVATVKKWFEETLKPALKKVWQFIQEDVIPAIKKMVEWLEVNIPIAIETVRKWWEETLKPALEKVWKFIQESVIPAIEKMVEWLEVNIPIAIETARKWWEETLKPALETVWEFIQDNVIPIIEDVVEWLEINIPKAIETAADFWENTLKPALEIVWDFIEEYLLPLFEALVDFFNTAFTLALTALAGLWENKLKPALEKVWKYIDENILPIFETLKEWLDDKLVKAVETVSPILEGLEKIFNAIGKAVAWVTSQIKQATKKMEDLDLPDWATPGSPTPFELGLRGIADAMKEVQALSGQVFAGMPSSIMVGAGAGARSVSPSASPGTQINNNVTHEGDRNEFNLTTQSTMQPGQLAMEFGTMAMRSR